MDPQHYESENMRNVARRISETSNPMASSPLQHDKAMDEKNMRLMISR